MWARFARWNRGIANAIGSLIVSKSGGARRVKTRAAVERRKERKEERERERDGEVKASGNGDEVEEEIVIETVVGDCGYSLFMHERIQRLPK